MPNEFGFRGRIVGLLLHYDLSFASCVEHPEPTARADSVGPKQVANIPYFIESNDFHSSLILNNNQTEEKIAVVTIFNQEGRPWQIPPIKLKPRVIQRYTLDQLLRNAPRDFRSGNIQIVHHGLRFDVMAQLTIVSQDQRLSFESTRTAASDFVMSRLDGIYWVPDDETEAKVALTNTADSRLKVSLISDRKEEKVSLNPRETRVVDLRELVSEDKEHKPASLVTLEHDGAPGALIATGFSLNRRTGFSSNITFADCGTAKSQTLAGAHLRVGPPNPGEGFPSNTSFRATLLVANTMDQPTEARISVEYTMGGQPARVQLSSIRLGARQVKRLELAEELKDRGITGLLDDAGVDIAYDDMPGTVIARLTSYDRSKDYTFDVPIKDPLGGPSNGSYPWRLDDGYTTILHLKNTLDKEVSAIFKLIYESGEYNPVQVKLAPHQTLAIDIGKVRDAQQKDLRGVVMPRDVETGKVMWLSLDPQGVIIGRAEVEKIRTGIASSFSCNGCECSFPVVVTGDPNYRPFLTPFSLTVNAGASGTFFGLQVYKETFCNNDVWGPMSAGSTPVWQTSDSNIASVSDQTITAVRAGTVTITGSASAVVAYGFSCAPQVGQAVASAPLTVNPTVTNITPQRGARGVSTHVTIAGSGFVSGPTINAGSNVTISNITVNSTTSITADVLFDTSATGGSRGITVTANGKTSNNGSFYVQIPSALSVLSSGVSTGYASPLSNGCPASNVPGLGGGTAGPYGMLIFIRYQVMDQDNPAQAIVATLDLREDLGNFVVDGQSVPGGVNNGLVGNSGGTTASDGTFTDPYVGGCATGVFNSSTFDQDLFMSTDHTLDVRGNHWALTGRYGCGNMINGNDVTVTVSCP